MQVFGFRERYRSALCRYTHQLSKLCCAISLLLICTTQFRNHVNLAAQFGNCVNFTTHIRDQFAISKLVPNFAIFNLRSTISKLRKFANCAEHIYNINDSSNITGVKHTDDAHSNLKCTK